MTTTLGRPGHELVIPVKYALTTEYEIATFPGVAYKLQDGRIRTELFWGSCRNVCAELVYQAGDDYMFAVYHVFVERYVNRVLQIPFDRVDIFRFNVFQGEFPEIPSDLLGTPISSFQRPDGRQVWSAYEHICGPYFADGQELVSKLSTSQLKTITAEVPFNLIPDRMTYLANPQDLPIIGVSLAKSEIDVEFKHFRDTEILDKPKKPVIIN